MKNGSKSANGSPPTNARHEVKVLKAKLRIARDALQASHQSRMELSGKLALCEAAGGQGRVLKQLSKSQAGKTLLTTHANLVGPARDNHVLGPNWMVENTLRQPEDYVLLLTKNCNNGGNQCKPGEAWFVHKNAVQKLLLQNGNKAVHPISRMPLDTKGIKRFLQHLEERKKTRSSNTAKPPITRLSAAALMSLRPRTRARTSAI